MRRTGTLLAVAGGDEMIPGCIPAALLAALLVAWTDARAVTITVSPFAIPSSYIDVDAIDAGAGQDTGADRALLTTLGDGFVTDSRGPNAAYTGYSLSNDAFRFELEHTRGTASSSWARTGLNLLFRPDADVDYVLAGGYATVDPDGGKTSFYVALRDYESGTLLFENFQESASTPDEAFALGLEEGDKANLRSGSIAGSLLAGRTYQLNLQSYINSGPGPEEAPSQASATGDVSLQFVPEPSAAALLGLGLFALTVRARRLRTPSREH